MKKFLLFILTILLLCIIGAVSYVAYNYIQEKNSLQFDLISSPDSNATSTTNVNYNISTDKFATSTANTTSWKTYTNDELGFSLMYPPDLIVNQGGASFILAFPKKTYFHWPLEDDVILTVIASSTCVSHSIGSDYERISTSTITINKQKYILSEGSGAAAGNIYKRSIFDVNSNEACFSFIIDSHGANGAGMYVDDPVLIKKYNDQHTLDVSALTDTVYGIITTFSIRRTPPGQLER